MIILCLLSSNQVGWAEMIKKRDGRRSDRVKDVERLLERVRTSGSTLETGMILLEDIEQYDDEFFAVLDGVIASEKANQRLNRVRNLELLRKQLRETRRRANTGER